MFSAGIFQEAQEAFEFFMIGNQYAFIVLNTPARSVFYVNAVFLTVFPSTVLQKVSAFQLPFKYLQTSRFPIWPNFRTVQ